MIDSLSPYASVFVARYPWRSLSVGLSSLAFDGTYLRDAGALWVRYGGTGAGGGFSAFPDFTRYACFMLWPSAARWFEALETLEMFRRIREVATEWGVIGLVPYRCSGTWCGESIEIGEEINAEFRLEGPIAVLTRATIRMKSLYSFWRKVAPVYRELSAPGGALCAIGFGEYPWIRQATLSLWSSERAMTGFAYQASAHAEVVRRTRKENWYSEDMFARFKIDYASGVIYDVALSTILSR